MTQPNVLDLGSDLSCVSDLNPHMGVVSGRRLLAEAIARRLQTPKGALLDDPNYGYDLVGQLNADISQGDLGRIAAAITSECQKDQRVFSAAVTVVAATIPGAGNTSLLGLKVTISLITGVGPFSLVIGVAGVTLTLLSIGT
jgi:hypothetical protein